jgi:hypothetical protein
MKSFTAIKATAKFTLLNFVSMAAAMTVSDIQAIQ